jgi:hypothetical protein
VIVERAADIVKPDAGVRDRGSVVGTARLDEEDLRTGRGQFSGQDRAGRTCSYYDEVVSFLFVQCVVHFNSQGLKSYLSDGGPMPQTAGLGANWGGLKG